MVTIAGDNRNTEIKQITMIVNGSQLSECTIISDEFPHITKLQCFEMNFSILREITKVTFNTSWEEIETFLHNNRNLFDVLCQNLIAFDVSMVTEDGGLPQYYCKDGILFKRAGNEACLIKYPIGRRDDVVIVPECSEENAEKLVIGRSAFEGATFVKKIKFSGFVSEVHDYAFKNCISLETIESEKLPFIGKDAFEK